MAPRNSARIWKSRILVCSLGCFVAALLLLSSESRNLGNNFFNSINRYAHLPNGCMFSQDYSYSSSQTVKPRVHGYKVILEPQVCAHRSPYLITFVHSAVPHFAERENIRNTWGSIELRALVDNVVIFVLGKTVNDSMIAQEDERYHDILQFNFCDTYDNLTLKHIAWIEWLTAHCSGSKFILKTDDDVFIDPFNLKSYLRSINSTVERSIFCGPVTKFDPIRNLSSKWYVSCDEYPSDTYGRMCAGMAYIMTPDLPELLHEAAKKTPFFRLDDVYVLALLAKKVNANHIDVGPDRSANQVDRNKKDARFNSGSLLFALMENFNHFRTFWKRLTARHSSFFGNSSFGE